MARTNVDPAVLDKAVKDLGITSPIYSAYIEGDTLVIHSREGTDTLPIASGSQADLRSATSLPAEEPPEATGLDDFTAIDGVGPKYAEILHDAGLFTYHDLRDWSHLLEDLVPKTTAARIRAWLSERMF